MSAYSITPSARTSRRRHVEADCLGGLQVDHRLARFLALRRSEAVRLKIKHLLTIPSPNRGRLGRESASKAKQQMLGKSGLVKILSRDLARARNRREALASDVITLTAEIAVLEASLLTENDRRERERAARRKANDEECIRVFKAAGYKAVEPRFNVLTYKKWLEKGRRVKKGEKGLSVGPFKLFHEDQTEFNGSSGLPLPIERVIPQQPNDDDPVLRPPKSLPRSNPTKKESSEVQCSTASSTMYGARTRRGGASFAGTAVALTAFVATYLLFNGEEQLPNTRATQLESIQGSILEKKSNRLTPKEEEEIKDQAYSPKPVRLEKYHLPTDGDSNSSKRDRLLYLADYAYSEVPPDEKPAETVFNSLKDIPIGTPIEEIKRASEAFGLDFNFMKAVAKIESDFDPKQRTGSYIGLFQLSKYEFAEYGSGDILNARDNAVAAAYKFATAAILFELNTHQKATLSDLYLIHQQGTRGAEEHVNHPDRIAWKSMCATDEGKQKGEQWCKRAIWENTLPEVKHVWKSVENLTSGVFVKMWQERVDRFYSRYSEATTN